MWTSDMGEDNECNKFVGTDNTIVPPLLSPEQGLLKILSMTLFFPFVIKLHLQSFHVFVSREKSISGLLAQNFLH